MKLAIMQPYFFPYLGYWQLIHAVDRFVIFDDVNFINRGWINRNRILINGEPSYLTMPLQQASQNKLICDISIQPAISWCDKLVKSVDHTYRKAPYFADVFPVIEKTIRNQSDNLSDYLAYQLQTLSHFMGIATDFVATSRCYQNNHLAGQTRILDICKREHAEVYINPEGGQGLYDGGLFQDAGIELNFIVMRPVPYKQRTGEFIPYLSIIDALMEVGPAEIKNYLGAYDLIEAK